MKKLIALLSVVLFSAPALADSTINNLGAGATVQGTDIFPVYQGANPAVRVTGTQLKTFFGGGTVTSVATGCGLSGGAISTTGTIIVSEAVNAQTGTTYAIANGDCGKLVTTSNASAVAVSIAQAGAGGNFAAGWSVEVQNKGAGTVTITPATSTINGAATLALTTNQGVRIVSDGTNYQIVAGIGGSGGGGTPANPTGTAGPTAVNGSLTTYMRSDAAPAIQLGTSSIKGIVQVDGTTITASSGVITAATGSASQKGILQVDGTTITASSGVITAVGGGGAAVTSIATSCGVSGGTITSTGTLSSNATTAVQTGSNYGFLTTDCGSIVYLNSASAQVPTIPQAGTTGFLTGWYVEACNIGTATQTITPATSTIGGAASFILGPGSASNPSCIGINSDGTNYLIDAIGPNFAKGTAVMGTSAIASATCATVVTVAAFGVATTDVVTVGFNGDPTAVTGYIPLTTGMLTIIPYPSSGNVNFKVCNNTASSITPGAITLNWQVGR